MCFIQHALSRRLWIRSIVSTAEQGHQVSYVDGMGRVNVKRRLFFNFSERNANLVVDNIYIELR